MWGGRYRVNIAFCFYTNTCSPQQSPSLTFSSVLHWGGTFFIAPKSWQGLQKGANVSYWCCFGSSVGTWLWMEFVSLASWPSASSNVKRSDKTNIILAVSQGRACHAAATSKTGTIRSLVQQNWTCFAHAKSDVHHLGPPAPGASRMQVPSFQSFCHLNTWLLGPRSQGREAKKPCMES